MIKNRKFRIIDALLLTFMILPILGCVLIKILTYPKTEGLSISGAMVFFEINMPIQNLIIGEAQINSLAVLVSVFFLCLFLTHGISNGVTLKRHYIAEYVTEKMQAMVEQNMGKYFSGFAPFITAILVISAFSSLLTLFGLYAPTSDLNIVAGWAILVFVLITYYKFKCGPIQYIKSFANPPLMAPLNIISEIATPISMAFRHYGNILSGSVISVLVAFGLRSLSENILGNLPGFLEGFSFLQVGLPAILSIYFDVFSGLLQAYIFAMLTMLYISGGFPLELYEKRKKAQTCRISRR